MVRFVVKECKTTAAFTAKPLERLRLDLGRLKQGYPLLFESQIAVLVLVQEEECVVHAHGEILFKQCRDMTKMEAIAAEVYDASVL